MNDKYLRIINMKRPVSKKHKPMSMADRAAQFGAFAALSGYDNEIKETGRITINKIEIDEEQKIELNRKLQILKERILEMPEVKITYFVKDEKKEGGRYIEKEGRLKKIDEFKNEIVFENKTRIIIKDIIKIIINEKY